MLVIDDNMFKLARMQEALLKVSTSNKEENLKNYKRTVAEIDAKAFEDVLEETKHIDEHNRSLEEELQFLEKIKKAYDQLLELQLGFKRNCEIYGDTELKLSDLSRLNIEYIENRINAINGYLINLKNIETNKKRLQELNEKLIEEEKKKLSLDKKLLELDELLINNFYSSEGRCIVDGKLQYTSVITEYEKIGLDIKGLLDDGVLLESILLEAEKEKEEISEKVKAVEVCYNNILTPDSRQILDEINIEFLKIKYKVAMLKIVELLSKNSNSYDMFITKRENILDLIKYRLSCMEKLGMKNSIDPFGRTKVNEQLNAVLSLTDNSKTINTVRKEISQLSSWTEEMLSQNNNYLITLNDTRKLIEDNIGLGDIDISSVVSFEELLVKQQVADNQVISLKNVPVKLNMIIVSQKTASVIKRVNQMMNSIVVDEKKLEGEIVPELVIVPTVVNDFEEVNDVDFTIPVFEPKQEEIEPAEDSDDVLEEELSDTDIFAEEFENTLINEDEEQKVETVDFDMFQTVKPFEEPSLFIDRVDEERTEKEIKNIEIFKLGEIETIESKEPTELIVESGSFEEEMPEVFWVTQEEKQEENENVISFDDQINALLSSENNDAGRSRKRAA